MNFADVRLPWGKRYVLLVCSRLLRLRLYSRKTLTLFREGLEAAFGASAGSTRAAVRSAQGRDPRQSAAPGQLGPGRRRVPPRSHALGLPDPRVLGVRAQTKGKVECPAHYLRRKFLYGREFLGDADLAAQAERWLEATATRGSHGTTRGIPRVLFGYAERPALLPLAPQNPRIAGEGELHPAPMQCLH